MSAQNLPNDVMQSGVSLSWTAGWLPSVQQMSNALQFQFAPLPDDEPVELDRDDVVATSMRQGMGMIVIIALLAGLLPILISWVSATRVGTTVPLARMAYASVEVDEDIAAWVVNPAVIIAETGQTIAGLEPAVFPGWLAAGLSALGLWINWPLRWLTFWLVYGLLVLSVSKLLGSTVTLQRFYAVTSYAVVPLLLVGLGPIACLGFLARLVAMVWSFAIYVFAVRTTTRLRTGPAILSVLAPAAVVALMGVFATLSAASTLVALWL